ncbi:glycosyltransferase family 4 protein [Novosphingobium album (ex Hu et al. 2023)]|uniref:Glycosyltransferase family 4 protein n=1 Tax=Novosphingobium album (ex Hu et al. 2023) TaxID=2930093 RepID=A0ABT0B6A3_9SPHN|nr:glycosyltransferase family 1 protein [Novosphingobium album (ex Hu et al. 2023)]MCJ2180606.1 glycosyltransferase family 4 protein [Novosphingobium album (ex Hu et al. 2023)]
MTASRIFSPETIRIGIDGFNLAMPKGTGVANYGMNLARAVKAGGHPLDGVFGLDAGRVEEGREVAFFDLLGREMPVRPKAVAAAAARALAGVRLQEVPLTDRVEKRAFADRLPNFDRIFTSALLFQAADVHFRVTRSFLKVSMPDPPQVMHWTYPVPVRMVGAKNIYTLHDLVPLRMPYATLDEKDIYRRIISGCLAAGDRICTVSEASRRDIMETFNVPADKVVNTYQSSPVPDEVSQTDPSEDASMIQGLFSLEPKSYFLFFGALDPKKNLPRIIEAYLTSHSQSPLVIVGARDWGMAGERNALASGVRVYGHQASGRIVQLDYMPRALLCRMIRNAKAVIFPSLYEGFGLPVLEAIQLGTPVITSNVSSLPEVAGDAGLMVDPYDVRDIAAAIRQIDDNPLLVQSLRNAGVQQAELFSEENYQGRLEHLYSTTLGAG